MKQERKTYDAAFKMKAVEMSRERTNVTELARELGISATLLYKWRRAAEARPDATYPGRGRQVLSEDQRRIRELEKKLKDAELERDILKKAVSIFSRSGQ